ncbi:hypothetical protein ORS3428_03810 [Mesorhizobium sp. ORS 3428]|nr:hypothetical protein ORS3428_03810 [Mesorhizobium sp. ORS 3428]
MVPDGSVLFHDIDAPLSAGDVVTVWLQEEFVTSGSQIRSKILIDLTADYIALAALNPQEVRVFPLGAFHAVHKVYAIREPCGVIRDLRTAAEVTILMPALAPLRDFARGVPVMAGKSILGATRSVSCDGSAVATDTASGATLNPMVTASFGGDPTDQSYNGTYIRRVTLTAPVADADLPALTA